MEIPTPDGIVANILRLTDEVTIDLIVHPHDAALVRAAVDGRPDRFHYRVRESHMMMPGRMVVVDKSALLGVSTIGGEITGVDQPPV